MCIAKILIFLVVMIVSIHCTPSWDAAAVTTKPTYLDLSHPNTHAAISAELLDVVKKFQTSTASPKTSVTTVAPVSSSSNRISIMHFPTLDPSSRSSDKSSGSSLVPGVMHPQSIGLDLHVPDNQMMEKPSSLALPAVGGPAGNALPGSVSPPATLDQTAGPPLSSPPADLQATPPEKQPIVVRLPPKFNVQELQKLLTDLQMTPVTPQIPLAPAPNPVPETLPHTSSGSMSHPPEVSLPMLKPNQSPLDYLLSSESPIKISNPLPGSSVTSNPSLSTKPRPNLEFVKYLLTLPCYQQALIDLIKTQS